MTQALKEKKNDQDDQAASSPNNVPQNIDDKDQQNFGSNQNAQQNSQDASNLNQIYELLGLSADT